MRVFVAHDDFSVGAHCFYGIFKWRKSETSTVTRGDIFGRLLRWASRDSNCDSSTERTFLGSATDSRCTAS
jgi:hypothetical protein